MSESSSDLASGLSPIPRRGNRRRSPRRQPRGNARIVCRKGTLGLNPNVAESIGDVTQTGALLLLREALEPGQEVEVGLQAPGNVREFKMVGRIVWCSQAASGSFWVGIEFDKPLSYSAFQDLSRL
jgi:hypothetical protein